MAQNAIGQTPNIFLQGGQMYQNANSKIFDAINGAADMYEKMQAQKQANLTTLLAKQAEINSDPEKASLPILAKAQQFGVDALSPQEKALFNASQQIQGSKVAIQPATGQSYNPYAAISLDSIGKPAAPSPAAQMMAPIPQPSAEMLPPPRVDGKPSSTADYKASVAPTPLGEQPEKAGPKVSVQDTSGVGSTPVGQMEAYKANLDAQKEIVVNNAKTQAELKKAEFYKPKLQDVLDKMADLNQQLQDAGALKSKDKSGMSNALNIAAGVDLPLIGKPGRAIEEVANKKIASLRDRYDGLKATAMNLYKNAANIAAGSMNSDAEQKLALSSFGDPNGSYEANKGALQATMESFGTKKADKSGIDNSDPRVKKALDAGYSLEEIKAPWMAESRPSLDDIFSAPQGPMVINIGKQPKPSLDEIFAEPTGTTGAVGTGIKALAQGMTGNTADEIDAYLTSKGLNPFSDKIPYEEKLAFNRGNDKADAAANPGSDLAGQVAGGVLDAAALGGAFPTAVKALASVASKGVLPSLATSGGVGAASGAIYGAGAGEGDASSRLKNAGDSGLLGGLFGIAGAAAARPIASLTERALKLVGRTRANIPQPTLPNALPRSPVAPEPMPGSVIPLTKGQATQIPQLQSLENMARSGAIDDVAQEKILQADYAQQDAIKNTIDKVTGGDDQNALTNAGNTLKQGYKSIKGQVSKAYDDAAVIRNVFVDKKPLAESFAPRVNDIMNKQGFDATNVSPESKKVLDGLSVLKDPKVSAVNLEKMEFWRRKLSNRIEQLKGDPEGVMLGRVLKSYDDVMGKLPVEALKSGDENALNAINGARALRRRQGTLFERDKVVSNIVKNDNLTNEELANLVLTGSERGQNINAGTGRAVKAMKLAAGDNAEDLVSNLRKGTFSRILNKSMVNTQREGTDVQMISPSKLLKELDGLSSNQSFMREVFNDSHRKTIDALRGDLRKVASEQPGSRNYSNTAYTIITALRRLPLGLSAVGAIAQLGLKPIAEKTARDELNKSLQGVLGEVQSELMGKAKLYGAASGGSFAAKGKEE